jgi:hypothetical protein
MTEPNQEVQDLYHRTLTKLLDLDESVKQQLAGIYEQWNKDREKHVKRLHDLALELGYRGLRAKHPILPHWEIDEEPHFSVEETGEGGDATGETGKGEDETPEQTAEQLEPTESDES